MLLREVSQDGSDPALRCDVDSRYARLEGKLVKKGQTLLCVVVSRCACLEEKLIKTGQTLLCVLMWAANTRVMKEY